MFASSLWVFISFSLQGPCQVSLDRLPHTHDAGRRPEGHPAERGKKTEEAPVFNFEMTERKYTLVHDGPLWWISIDFSTPALETKIFET